MTGAEERRVAVFVPSMGGGGAERVAVNLVQGFARRGLGVDLLLVRPEGPLRGSIPSSVRVVELKGGRILASLPALVAYLWREEPDAVLAHLGWCNLVAVWARALARTETRLVLTVHNTYSRVAVGGASLRKRLLPVLARWFYPSADAVVGVSRGVVEDLLRVTGLPAERATVVYNPVLSDELAAKTRRVSAQRPGGDAGPPLILGVGRLTPQKNFTLLLRAFRRIADQRDCRLAILGEGPELDDLERTARELGIADRVSFPGFVEDPGSYYRRAAVFVLSSDWEGLPTVLIEAMAYGCPVVSTRCPSGPEEILEDGALGRLVTPGDEFALAGAVLETMRDPPPANKLQRRAADFGADRAVEAYLRLLFPERKA